jgi:putative hydrolase of HD superfamily
MNRDPTGDRLRRQLEFMVEVDALKTVIRRSYLTHDPRRENSAEHSWHLAVAAMLLSEYAAGDVDLLRVLKMVLIHDLVEIDAGDTYCYDEEAAAHREARERKAADRIFGLLPEDQAAEFRALWEEFEAGRTPEARFGAALDRLQPLLQNFFSEGVSWKEHGIRLDQVMARSRPIGEFSQTLWQAAEEIIRKALRKGYLVKTRSSDTTD